MFELEQIRLGLSAYDEKLKGNGGFTLTSLAPKEK